MKDKSQRLLSYLASSDVVFFMMPALMALLVVGTVAQRWMGLYPALDMFFASFFFWTGPVPLPGGYTLLGLLSLGLTLKFITKSTWNKAKAGINLAHLGALILLIGSLVTAMSARESYMLIPEGQETPYIYDYQRKALMVFENDHEIARLPFENIEHWSKAELPFALKVGQSCQNCTIIKREDAPASEETLLGMANFMALENDAPSKNPEEDLSGFSFNLDGLDESHNGHYIAFDGMPKTIEVQKGPSAYKLIFGKEQSILPFTIALTDFVKNSYGGTDMARSYHSDIIIKDGNLEWPARIEMNKPLRYKGYTFFQSSFERTPDTEITILAVVENKGRLFPYIGAFVIGFGLLLHLLTMVYERRTT